MESNESNPFFSVHLPLTLIAGAGILFFASQNANIDQGTSSVKWQTENTDKLIKNFDESKKTLEKNVESRKALVVQSEQTQKQFETIMREVDELARGGDKDADLVMKTYGIKVNPPDGTEKPDSKPEEKKPADGDKKPQ